MQYMMMFYDTAENRTPPTDAAQKQAYFGAWGAFMGAMKAAGIFVNGDQLQSPATATTVRLRDNKRQVQDGPFADTKEQLGGYVVIDVPSLDVALQWAARCPTAATGAVEVRPVVAMPLQQRAAS
jgi:hypothetical protein